MNSSLFGQTLVRFLPYGLWLAALVCLVLQVGAWMRVHTAPAESLDDKYFIASGSQWLLAAIILGLLGVVAYVGTAPLARWTGGAR